MRKGLTYRRPLWLEFTLHSRKNGLIETFRSTAARLPMLTPEASFIIDGKERVCINELTTAPGAYCHTVGPDKHPMVRLVPRYGPTLRFFRDSHGKTRIRFGRNGHIGAEIHADQIR